MLAQTPGAERVRARPNSKRSQPMQSGARQLTRPLLRNGLIIVVVLSSLIAVSSARAGGDSRCSYCSTEQCCGGGGGGGSCPTPYVMDIASASVTNSTNATVMFWTTSGSPEPTGLAYVKWGPTTSYGAPTASNSIVPESAGISSEFINYLSPNTTYYYEVISSASCTDSGGTHTYSGSTTGTFTTGSDNFTHITGVVYDANGNRVGSGFALKVTCVNVTAHDATFFGFTNSEGAFSINIVNSFLMGYPFYDCQNPGDGGFYIQAENGPYIGGGITWVGHWNETIITSAPQVVNFYLPMDFVAPNVSMILDFSNAPAGDSSLQYTSGTSYSTTLTNDWSISGQFGVVGVGESGSSSTTYQISTNSGVGSTNGTLDFIAQWETTGVVLCNTIVRGCAITWVDNIGLPVSDGFSSQDPGFAAPHDWLKPGTNATDVYPLKDVLGVIMLNKYVGPGSDYTGSVTTSTTNSSTGGYSWSLGFSISIPGMYIPVGGVSASMGWSQTSSETTSQTLSWEVDVPNGGTARCFDVFGQGGSTSSGDSDMVGIFSWSPSNGTCRSPS